MILHADTNRLSSQWLLLFILESCDVDSRKI
jgi:hypothetical protein